MLMRKVLLMFILMPLVIKAQYTVNENIHVSSTSTVTSFNYVTGYIEVHDQAYFERLDHITQQLYMENMEYYNKGLDFYNAKDYESAYFYFNKAFRQGFFSRVKLRPDNEVLQNKALYQLLSILKTPHPNRGDVQDAWELVKDECDPSRRKIANEEYYNYKSK